MARVAIICCGLLVICSNADAQVIQLPSQQIFHVTTTVSVPDRGRMSLGGVSRHREGSVSRGVPGLGQLPGIGRLFKNRGIGRESERAGLSVNAQIISLEEQEELQTGYRSADVAKVNRQAAFLAKNLETHSPVRARKPEKAPPSSADIQRKNELAKRKQETELQAYIAKGKEAEADGKLGVAKIYYGMAQRRATGQMKFYITRHLNKMKQQQQEALAKKKAARLKQGSLAQSK